MKDDETNKVIYVGEDGLINLNVSLVSSSVE